jgi:hypothetical protein
MSRQIRYRMPDPGEGEPRPERGDYMMPLRHATLEPTGTVYAIDAVTLARESVEAWDFGPELGEAPTRVLHYRLRMTRIPPAERPEDAMTWHLVYDRKRPPTPSLTTNQE